MRWQRRGKEIICGSSRLASHSERPRRKNGAWGTPRNKPINLAEMGAAVLRSYEEMVRQGIGRSGPTMKIQAKLPSSVIIAVMAKAQKKFPVR